MYAWSKGVTAQMAEIYEQEGGSIVAVQEVQRQFTNQYGIVSGTAYKDHLERMHGIVEKPKPEEAPSTLAVAGALCFVRGKSLTTWKNSVRALAVRFSDRRYRSDVER